jgi:ribulose-5-phosphate 4-epimerase/fuculose-1-phosphate aldolase
VRTDQLIYWCKRFGGLGLVPETSGNLSFRTRQGFIITGTGFALGTIEEGNLVEVLKVDMEDGRSLVQVQGKVIPSKEAMLHAGIYDLKPEIKAVIHVHDQLVLEYADELGLPRTEAWQLGGSYKLAREVQKLLNQAEGIKYAILRDHGIISLGETMEEAGRMVEDIHRMAQNTARKKG